MASVVEFILAGFTDNSGNPLAGGKVYTYAAGTTTPKAVYTDNLGTTPDTNPVILDSNGRKQIYGSGSYKFVVKTSADATLYTLDNLYFGNEAGISFIGTTSGSGNTYTAAPSPSISSYVDGQLYTFQADKTNTGAATLNINGVGAKSITGAAGAIVSGNTYTARYSSGADAFYLLNPSAAYATTPAEISALNTAGVEIVIRQAVTLTGNLTLTAPLRIEKGGSIVLGTFNLVINGPFKAGVYQVFNAASSGVVTFGAKAEPTIYAEWWGVVGDGSTDDTTKLQQALTAATGRTVQLLATTYKITSSVSMAANSGLLGCGYQKTIINQATANTSCVNVNNDNEVAYIKFTGTGSLSTLGNEVIFFDPVGSGLIGKRCWVHHNYLDSTISTSGIGGNNMIDVWIEDNIIDFGTQGEHGIYISGGSDRVWVARNKITRSGVAAVSSLRAIHLKGASNLHILDNEITGTWNAYGISFNDFSGGGVAIRGNRIEITYGSTFYPISLGQATTLDGVIVEGNYIKGGTAGIWGFAKNMFIAGNYIRDTTYGIDIDGTTGTNITDCTIKGNFIYGTGTGIRVQSGQAGFICAENTLHGVGGVSTGIGISINSGVTDMTIYNNYVRSYTTGYAFNVSGITRYNNYFDGTLHSGALTSISAAGTTRADATQLSNIVNDVTTVAASTGVLLWNIPIGTYMFVRNAGANALLVYAPDGSSTINGGGAGGSVSVATNTLNIFIRLNATTWIGYEFTVAAA